jgi:hypothetical protein
VNGTGRKACFDDYYYYYYYYYVRKLYNDDISNDDYDNNNNNNNTPPVDHSGIWSFSGQWHERMSRGVLLPVARFSYSKAFCGSVESKVYRRKRRTTFHVRGNMWSLIMGSLNEENRWTQHIAVFRNRR